MWYYREFIEIHILIPLTDLTDITNLEKMSYKRVLQLLNSYNQKTERENAITWYEAQRQKIISKFTKPGQQIVNDEFIHDHIVASFTPPEERENDLSYVLSML